MPSHVIVLRHCVRSTKDRVHINNNETVRIQDLIGKLPAWNVPIEWCTETGVQQVTQLATYLAPQISNITINIIADVTSQRDIDTAWRLAAAMDVESIRLESHFFKPYNICDTTSLYTPQDEVEFVQNRLSQLEMPTTLQETLTSLQQLFPQLQTLELQPPTIGIDPKHQHVHIQGTARIYKLLSQMIFYSQASGLPFVNITTHDTMLLLDLIRWNYWVRAVENTRTIASAVRGAYQFAQIHHHLQHHKKNDDVTTIYVGHDGDLNALATVLDLDWQLAEYPGSLIPTPPLSFLHFAQGSQLEVDVGYPVFDGPTVKWKRQPLFVGSRHDLYTQFLDTIAAYPGASECAVVAAAESQQELLFVAIFVPLVVLLGLICLIRCCRKRCRQKAEQMESVSSPSLTEDMEMI